MTAFNINFRLSDGHSFAVEFSAENVAGFRVSIASAYSDYRMKSDSSPELHVCTDHRMDWISPNYPESNAAVLIRKFMQPQAASELWNKSIRALNAGNYLDKWLAAHAGRLIDDGANNAVQLTIINGGKS